jgi:broad specificity phosphatase PhoE
MSPKRIMFIRHAEKPGVGNDDGGVAPVGAVDMESLTVRGWQRAGALVGFFNSRPDMRPRAIFASGIGHQSKSKRPMETVMPLAEFLKQTGETAFVTKHLKDDLQPFLSAMEPVTPTIC